jgi:hypothetical protein
MLKPRLFKPHLNDLAPHEAAIYSVLDDECRYKDGPPHWLVSAGKPYARPCQTDAEARSQSTENIARLYRLGGKDFTFWRLVRRLESCRPGHRCGNGACAECQRALCRWFVANASAATITAFRRWLLLSIVPDYAATSAMNPTINWPKVVDRLCQDLANAGIKRAIGGADFSVNIDRVNGGTPVLQGQFWLLIEEPRTLWGNWFEDLKIAVNASGAIKRPLRRKVYTGSLAMLGYAIKNTFNQHQSYLKTPNPVTRRNPHLNTRDKKLRNDRWLQLQLFLDRIGLEGRLINHGAIACNSRGQLRVVMEDGSSALMAGKKTLRVNGLLKGLKRRF